MIFVDRCFLARYSIESFNAAVNAGTLGWAFLGSAGMLCGISQVFVAQYQGANCLDKIGKAVWQAIWISLLLFLLFLPIAFLMGPLFHSSQSPLQTIYFKWLMIFAPFYPLTLALSGFYVGRGNTKPIMLLAFGANFVNIILDWLLIFGFKDIIPEMGIKGAAIATSCGSVFQAAILLYCFLRKKNQKTYHTLNCKIDFSLLKKMISIGMPQAIFYFLEILGWTIFFQMMSHLGTVHITVTGICQSLLILFSFFFEGLNRGVSSMAAFFIGSNQKKRVKNVFFSGLKLQSYFALLLSILLLIDPAWVFYAFIPANVESLEITSSFLAIFQYSLIYLVAFIFLDGIRWILAGILTAAGDTRFLMFTGCFAVWLCLLLPEYLIVVKNQLNVDIAWLITVFFGFTLCVIYYWRYSGEKWAKISLLDTTEKLTD